MTRRTKIVATLGPASQSPEVLEAMVDAGVDVARVGLAHESADRHAARIRAVRAAARERGRVLGVLADLPGPKVRTAPFPDGGVFLADGSCLRLVPDGDASSEESVVVTFPEALSSVEGGDRVVIGDGAVLLEVAEVGRGGVTARVVRGGRLLGRPGVHLPAGRLDLRSPTEEDLRLLETCVREDVDIVAVSLVRSGDDVRRVREAAGDDPPMIVAKIETPDAVEDLDAIIAAADGLMVARGDLGTRLRLEDVPHVQKRVIRTCAARGVPVITATQMLESMITAPTPTRAEVTDVANAVSQGTTAVMLSAETAVGQDPVAVVEAMARIIVRAEREFDHVGWGKRLGRQHQAVLGEVSAASRITSAITAAAWQASVDVEPAAIIACTRSGWTAKAISRFRPACLLLGVTPSEKTARQLSLAWGVTPIAVAELATTDDIVWCAVEAAVREGWVKAGDIVAVLAGDPHSTTATTDVLRLVPLR